MEPNIPQLEIAILVRKFPNIVQTYVLNHTLSLRNTGAKLYIIAERDPEQDEIHPRVYENDLLSDTLYVSTDLALYLKELLSGLLINRRYISAALKIIFSELWIKRGPRYTLKAIVRAKLFAHCNFKIIHSHSLFNSYDYLFLNDVFSIPLTATFHGLLPQNVRMLEAEKVEAVLNTCDAFFVNTEFARSQLTGLGCNTDKIHIIPQGTNTEDFPFKPRSIEKDEPITILSVGRLSIEKGFHIAIEAIASLFDQFPDIRYNIIGGGPEEQSLIDLIHHHKLQERVTIYGSVSTEVLAEQYSKAQIFLLPSIDFRDGSHTETQGVVLQEAQSSGIPVIASRTGGIPEVIIDGTTGLLFDEQDAVGLSEKIGSLLSDQALYQSLSLNARKVVEDNYSIESICRRQLKVYREVLSED